MTVSPLGSIHLCAVFGGNVMTGDSALAAEFKFAALSMGKIDKTRLSPGCALHWFRGRQTWRKIVPRVSLGFEWFHERFVKIINFSEVLHRIFVGLSENPSSNKIENHVANVFTAVNPPKRKNA